jgi:hypothetical protein
MIENTKPQGCGNRGKTNCMFFHRFHSPYYWKSQEEKRRTGNNTRSFTQNV